MYELFIHVAALLFFRFFAVNFYASQLEVFPITHDTEANILSGGCNLDSFYE